jgi:predicted amidophosphoribosyltransferase
MELEKAQKECKKCGRGFSRWGHYCAPCKRDIADEQYLDSGAVYQGDECIDRKNCGEYADLHEGNDIKEGSGFI